MRALNQVDTWRANIGELAIDQVLRNALAAARSATIDLEVAKHQNRQLRDSYAQLDSRRSRAERIVTTLLVVLAACAGLVLFHR